MKNIAKNGMKGQLAFEFLIIYSIFIVLFVSALFITSRQAEANQIYAEQLFARESLLRFSEEINIASLFNGYAKNYTFPRTIRGANYDLEIRNGLMKINYTTVSDISMFQALQTSDLIVNGVDTQLSTGTINSETGWMYINNSGGTVVITQ